MNGHEITLAGARLTAMGSGALWWAKRRLLCVSDLHLGKSDRMARRSGVMVPPYETRETLTRLEAAVQATNATTVVCLGDSFDDRAAADSLDDEERMWLARLQAGRRWVWIEGNHDPGPMDFGGSFLAELYLAPLTFRHIAKPGTSAEISGHYHPKAVLPARGRQISRPCFLVDGDRMILPAFGAYTGGLRSDSQAFSSLLRPDALAILTGPKATAVPMPR